MKKVSHRGHSIAYPENSKSAFRAALTLNCDAIELDIHLNQSGELIIFHDYDMEDRPGIYTLKEYLVEIAPHTESFIELKADPKHRSSIQIKRTCNALHELLNNHGDLNFRILCFQHEWLKYLKEKNKDYNCVKNFYDSEGIAEKDLYYIDGFSFNIDAYDKSALSLGQAFNKTLMFWTCNTKKQIARAVSLNADYIMSDDIELITV